MSFKVGDLAVYPAQGIGMVQAIETKSISGGKKESFYVLRVLDTGVTIMIPMGNVEQVGLRRIMDAKAVRSIYKILQNREVGIEPQPWNRRYRQYMDKLKSGSPFEIAEVLRNLLFRPPCRKSSIHRNPGGSMTRVVAIIVAGGDGRRMGGDLPKQFLPLGGRPLLDRTLSAIAASARGDGIVLVLPPTFPEEGEQSYRSVEKVLAVVAGGEQR